MLSWTWNRKRKLEGRKRRVVGSGVRAEGRSDQAGDLSSLSRDSVNIVYCYSEVCHLAAQAAGVFAEHGYSVMELEGGFEAWQHYELPIES